MKIADDREEKVFQAVSERFEKKDKKAIDRWLDAWNKQDKREMKRWEKDFVKI